MFERLSGRTPGVIRVGSVRCMPNAHGRDSDDSNSDSPLAPVFNIEAAAAKPRAPGTF
jgi:hypothetical protein